MYESCGAKQRVEAYCRGFHSENDDLFFYNVEDIFDAYNMISLVGCPAKIIRVDISEIVQDRPSLINSLKHLNNIFSYFIIFTPNF